VEGARVVLDFEPKMDDIIHVAAKHPLQPASSQEKSISMFRTNFFPSPSPILLDGGTHRRKGKDKNILMIDDCITHPDKASTAG
jgi:hypothetical protein